MCANTNGPPPEGLLDIPCDHVEPDVAGWQIGILPKPSAPSGSWRECYAIGLASKMTWSLIDELDPAAGVQLSYGKPQRH